MRGRLPWTQAARRALLALVGLAVGLLAVPAAIARGADAQDMRAAYEALSARLAASPLGEPIVIDSVESPQQLSGSVHAVSKHPFSSVAAAFAKPQVWCEMMLLPFNARACQLEGDAAGPVLNLTITRKNAEDASQGHALRLDWRKSVPEPEYLHVQLTSETGPFGTAGYVIELRAIPLAQGRTFMHFTFAFRFGTAARMATQAYLATVGRDKVGFSTVQTAAGERLVGGMRGIVERNAMRYFLAIEAWLNAARMPAAQQLDARLENWFDATERYPRQLHEMDKSAYLAAKRRDFRHSMPQQISGG
jgi:hypothetical protein